MPGVAARTTIVGAGDTANLRNEMGTIDDMTMASGGLTFELSGLRGFLRRSARAKGWGCGVAYGARCCER